MLMGRRKTRRQAQESAWPWKQTDCWYYTLPGTKRRVPLVDEDDQRVRGQDHKRTAQRALARVTLAGEDQVPDAPAAGGEWLVARILSSV
jgi:hypothetical protein